MELNVKDVSKFIIDTIVEDIGYKVDLSKESSLNDIYMDSLDSALFISILESKYDITITEQEILDLDLFHSVQSLAEYIVSKVIIN